MDDLFIFLNKKSCSILRAHGRYYSPWEHMRHWQDHRRVNYPKILIRGLIFIKFSSWWLCRSFCMYSWRELEMSCPNLLPCRTALVYKTKSVTPCDALGWQQTQTALQGRSFLQVSGFKAGKPLSAPCAKCALRVSCRGRVGEGTSCCSFPSFVPHRGDTGFHGDAVGTGRAGAGQSSFQGNSCHAACCCLRWVLEGVCPAETNPRLPHCFPLAPSVPPRTSFLLIPLPFTSVTTAVSLVRCSSGILQHSQTEPGQSWGSQ